MGSEMCIRDRYDYYSVLHKISSARVLCFILMKDIGIEENTGGVMYIY